MEYEGSIGLVEGKIKNKNKKNPPYKLETRNFNSPSLLGQLDVPHTQNFEILTS
jgi:hypothetical protein